MTPEIALVLFILVVAVILFASERLRVDLVALIVLLSLILTGILTPAEAFSGFSNPAVITVWAIYIVSGSLVHTGVTDTVGEYIARIAGTGESRLIVVLMLTVGLLSAFMNNIGAAAMMLPVAISLAHRARISPSKLLIPLAFASLLGGTMTLIGTPPNLLVSGALSEFGLRPFGLFEFTPLGIIMLLSSVAYMLVIGRHLLPEHVVHEHASDLTHEYQIRDYLAEIYVKGDSALAGRMVTDGEFSDDFGVTILGVMRNGEMRVGSMPNTRIRGGDILFVQGSSVQLTRLVSDDGVTLAVGRPSGDDLKSSEAEVAEIVVSQLANFTGRTLRDLDFRRRFGLTVMAIWREESPIVGPIADVPLRMGDTLLVQGRLDRIEALRSDNAFLVLRAPSRPRARRDKAALNVFIFGCMIALVTLGVLHISTAAVLGAACMVLTDCLTMDEAYKSIEWKSVFLIAGMLPMGLALEQTGAAQYLADVMIGLVGDLGPRAVLVGLFALTTVLTAFMSNAAAAVLVAPIAIQTAQQIGVDAHAFAMGVAIAASSAFATPIGHQACVLVYGPGGYRFTDFTKVGIPLTLLIWALMLIFLPVFFPL